MGNICLFYSQNNKIVCLSNMADICLRNARGAQGCVGFFSWLCLLIGWAGKLRSSLRSSVMCDSAEGITWLLLLLLCLQTRGGEIPNSWAHCLYANKAPCPAVGFRLHSGTMCRVLDERQRCVCHSR